MARRSQEDHHVRKIAKTGGGKAFTLTLPIEFIRTLNWRGKQKVVVSRKGKHLIIKDWRK